MRRHKITAADLGDHLSICVIVAIVLFVLTGAAHPQDKRREFMGKEYDGLFRVELLLKECNVDRFGRDINCRQIMTDGVAFAIDNDKRGRTLLATAAHISTSDNPAVKTTILRIVVRDVRGRAIPLLRLGTTNKTFVKHPQEDLALLAINGKYESYDLADARKGEEAYCFGWPKKYVLRRRVVINGARTLQYTERPQPSEMLYFQETTKEGTNSGFSGGPVVNARGEVVGMNVNYTDGYNRAVPARVITDFSRQYRGAATLTRGRVQYEQRRVPVPQSDPIFTPAMPGSAAAQQAELNSQTYRVKTLDGRLITMSHQQFEEFSSRLQGDCQRQWQEWIAQQIACQLSKIETEQGPPGSTGATGATGQTGATGPAGPAGSDGKDAVVDLDALAKLLVREHREALKGRDGTDGDDGGDGDDGTSVTADDLRPIITQIVAAQVALQLKSRTDDEIKQLAEQVYASKKRIANVMVIDTSQSETDPAVVSGPTAYDIDREPVLLDMADFLIRN